jgi:hypothetical protein
MLPLSRSNVSSVAIIGPGGNSSSIINGGINYAGIPCGGAAVTVAEAFVSAGLATTVVNGCGSIACPDQSGFPAAQAAAAAADATVVVVAIDETIENEGLDRTTLDLPGNQAALITAACAAAHPKPCVVVVMSGGALDVSSVTPSISGGLFYVGFLGGSGAPALVDTIFGVSSPAGRLSQTVYHASFVNEVSMFDMGMRPGPSQWPPGSNPGRSYQFYTGTPVYQFGWGLSYTTFSVSVDGPSAVSLDAAAEYLKGRAHGALYAPLTSATVGEYRVNVTNTGVVDSDYVALGFLIPPGAGVDGMPLQTLFGFERVFIPAGQTVSVWLGVGARDLTRVTEDKDGVLARRPLPGQWKLRISVEGALDVAYLQFAAM